MSINHLKPIYKLNPFTKFCCTIGNLPSSYLDSMTYYEQLLWFCNFLEKTVIPTLNTNAEAVQELQNLFVELKNFVDNYFENLDVQEEINNKLDEMAENGTLENILLNYVNVTKVYNTTVEMLEDTNLKNGMKVKTLGYYEINDGGGADFIILSNELIENLQGLKINVDENLKALFIGSELNLNQFGAKGDSISDDTEFIQNAINYCSENNILLKAIENKTYLFSSTLSITNDYLDIDFNNATLKASSNFSSESDNLININIPHSGIKTNEIIKSLKNLKIDASFLNYSKVIRIDRLERATIKNLNIINAHNTAIYVGGGYEIFFENIFLNAYHPNASAYGVRIGIETLTDDLVFNNITAIDFKTFLKLNNTNNYFNNCHAWIADSNQLQGSRFADCEQGISFLNNCYSDTYENVLCSRHQNGNYKVNNLLTYFNTGFFSVLPELSMHILYQINNVETNFRFFSATSIKNSYFRSNNQGNTNYYYSLSNSIRETMADIDVSNSFRNINNSNTNRGTVTNIHEAFTANNNVVTASNNITDLHLTGSIDYSELSAGYITLGFIDNFKLGARTALNENVGFAVNETSHKVYAFNYTIDQSQDNTQYNNRIRMYITNDMITDECTKIYIQSSFGNSKTSYN